jgi:hypothetical protein
MIAIKDRVHPVFNMSQVGTVVQLKFVPTGMILVGGSAQQRMYAVLQLDRDGTLIEVPADELMRME